MIAKNYLKFPEALRFQCEMFHRSYKNSPRTMRLMECIFSFAASVPSWVREAKLRASALVKKWKAMQDVLPFGLGLTRSKPIKEWTEKMQMELPNVAHLDLPMTFPPESYIGRSEWNPVFTVEKADWSWGDGSEFMECFEGQYRSFCRRHQGGFQGYARGLTKAYAYVATEASQVTV